ncbi:TPA: hypothetical protein PCJ90_001359 [Klebsiella quasipneumoniae]|nr:hypothetical protein [Klebsiella quasipneumoniae]
MSITKKENRVIIYKTKSNHSDEWVESKISNFMVYTVDSRSDIEELCHLLASKSDNPEHKELAHPCYHQGKLVSMMEAKGEQQFYKDLIIQKSDDYKVE